MSRSWLAEHYRVSKATVTRTLRILAGEGWCEPVRGGSPWCGTGVRSWPSGEVPGSRARDGLLNRDGQVWALAHGCQPAFAMQPDGSALAPMPAAGTGCQDPVGVAPCTDVGGKTSPEPA
jgi:hypothetical protein